MCRRFQYFDVALFYQRRVTYGSDTTYRTVVALSRIVGNPAMYNYAQGQPKWRAMGSGRGRLVFSANQRRNRPVLSF